MRQLFRIERSAPRDVRPAADADTDHAGDRTRDGAGRPRPPVLQNENRPMKSRAAEPLGSVGVGCDFARSVQKPARIAVIFSAVKAATRSEHQQLIAAVLRHAPRTSDWRP